MATTIRTTVTNNILKFEAQQRQAMRDGMKEFAYQVLRDAKTLAPHLTGSLKDSGRVYIYNNEYQTIFGSGKVQYAVRRHYENMKNPQTLRYLERAFQANNNKSTLSRLLKSSGVIIK